MTTITKSAQPDRSKIDMRNRGQVKIWAKKLDISAARLQKVVETVGNSAVEVKKELGRSDVARSTKPARPWRKQI